MNWRVATFLFATLIPVEPSAFAQAVDADATWQRYGSALVQLEISGTDAHGGSVQSKKGVGTIIRSTGKIVTALHVIGGAEGWARADDGTPKRSIVVQRRGQNGEPQMLGISGPVVEIPQYDIAILDVNGKGFPNIPVSAERLSEVSRAVVILWDPTFSVPNPRDVQTTTTDRSKYGDMLTLVVDAEPGNSGSPVFDTKQRLTGIVTRRLDDSRALAVPSYLFQKFVPDLIVDCNTFTSSVNVTSASHSTPTVTVNVSFLDANEGCKITRVEPKVLSQRNFSELKVAPEESGRRAKVTFNLGDRPPGFASVEFKVFQEPSRP